MVGTGASGGRAFFKFSKKREKNTCEERKPKSNVLKVVKFILGFFIRRVHATLQPTQSVCRLVRNP